MKRQKGITLVALVVTIVVLLILAGITITMLFSDNGIIKKAQEAKEKTETGTANDLTGLKNLENDIDKFANGGSVTNPYKDKEWEMAWTCTNEVWSDTINKGETAEGDIVAKLYKTGNRITPEGFNFMGEEYTFKEGDEYVLILEGKGKMGALMQTENFNITGGSGWHLSTVMYMAGTSDTCVMPYVSEVVICDGITNIGEYAFAGDTSLTKIKMTNDVKEIGEYAFMIDIKLSNISIPNGVTSIGTYAFGDCISLTNVVIPSSVTSIGGIVFESCTSLAKVKIYTEFLSSVGNDIFNESGNAKVYVLNENIKNTIFESSGNSNVDIQIVTKEQMDQL